MGDYAHFPKNSISSLAKTEEPNFIHRRLACFSRAEVRLKGIGPGFLPEATRALAE